MTATTLTEYKQHYLQQDQPTKQKTKRLHQENNAVVVTDAYKRYSPQSVVLNGLYMTVTEGTIYGLLGPSGCGKTTLLNCIIGMATLDYGHVEVSVRHKCEIGYMPQELSLIAEFTISEIFNYYGQIYGISHDLVDDMGKKLYKLLELPPMARIIGHCSGGEQRRISLAVTLLHGPKLLILDEPTVGVDPVLTHSIWNYFTSIVREMGKTIIITTHYIEEAKQANKIGLMREGILLSEESPGLLMQQNNCNSLEDVFLKLSSLQNATQEVKSYPNLKPNIPPLCESESFSIHRFKAQATKNFKWTKRNKTITAGIVLLPSILLALLSYMTNSGGGTYPTKMQPLAVVNQESDCKNPNESVIFNKRCLPSRLISCILMEKLDETLKLEIYQMESKGIVAVKEGKAVGILTFNGNFSFSLFKLIKKRKGRRMVISEETIKNSQVQISLDTTNTILTFYMIQFIRDGLISALQEISEQCRFHEKAVSVPVEFLDPVHPERTISTSFLVPYFCSIIFYSMITYSSTALVSERKSGSFIRSTIAGLTTIEIFAAQGLLQLIVMIGQTTVSFITLDVIDYIINGSKTMLYLIIFCLQITGTIFGFFLSMLVSREEFLAYIGATVVVTCFIMTGLLWPTEGIHWLIVPLNWLLPPYYSTKAFLDVSTKGYGLKHTSVILGLLMPLIATCFLMVLMVIMIKRKIGFS